MLIQPSMFSLFLSSVIFIGSIAHALPINRCEVSNFDQTTCNLHVGFPSACKSSTLHLANSSLSTSCSSVRIFWDYPMNNLTVIIETPFTQIQQPYSIHLRSQRMKPQISHIYQVSESGAYTELIPEGDIITVNSNTDYQIILMFQAPTRMIFFGVYIEYDIIGN